MLAPGPAASQALPPLCAARPGPARPPAALPIRPGRRSPLRQRREPRDGAAATAAWRGRGSGGSAAEMKSASRASLPRLVSVSPADPARVPTATPRRRRERLRRYGKPPGGRGGVAGHEEKFYGPATTAQPRRSRGPLSRCLDNACLTLFNGSVNDSVRPFLSRQCRCLRLPAECLGNDIFQPERFAEVLCAESR